MIDSPTLIRGLDEIAPQYDALICDVWGVLHNGVQAYNGAVDALRRFRAQFGPVLLLSNAPRPVSVLEEQFKRFGVPKDCYDAIVTSGVAAHDELAERVAHGRLSIYHLGPERDRGVFDDLSIDCVEPGEAMLVLCTGLFDDDVEAPEDYRPLLTQCRGRDLEMLCANPDIFVQRGGQLVYCAGALAQLYEAMGGSVVYYGKPYVPIYDRVHKILSHLAGQGTLTPLAIGDGLKTDVLGAEAAGIDALFIAEGIHKAELGAFEQDNLTRLMEGAGVFARYALPKLVW